MEKKATSGIILTLLLTAMSSSAFNIPNIAVMGQEDDWIPYVPSADQVELKHWWEDSTSFMKVVITFASTGYNVSDWGTPNIVGNSISVNAEIWKYTGIDLPVVTKKSHTYNLGILQAGEYLFTFKAWGFSIKSMTFIVPPMVISFTVKPNPFSPNGDGRKDTTTIKATFNVVVNWKLQVRTLSGVVLRSWTGKGSSLSVVWDGKNSAGVRVPDGTYNLRLSGADLFGKMFTTKWTKVTVDTKPPTVTGVSVYPTSFNPRIGQTTKISYTLSESCYVTIKIYNSIGTLKRTLLSNSLQTTGPHSIVWNGKDSSGYIVSPGICIIKIYVVDKAGNKATPYPIIKTVTVL